MVSVALRFHFVFIRCEVSEVNWFPAYGDAESAVVDVDKVEACFRSGGW